MARTRTNAQRSIDPAAQQMLIRAEELGLGTAFTRAEQMAACPIGVGNSAGICCKNCFMGPCRLTKDGQVGVCGATVDTIAARNFARAVAAGAAAHSDHGRDMAFALLAVAKGEAQGYRIRDEVKLHAVAGKFGIPTDKRTTDDIARDVADMAIAQFGQQTGELLYVKTRPRSARSCGAEMASRRAASTARWWR